MRKRIAIYVAAGAVLAGALFYWLYLRPFRPAPRRTVGPDSEEVKKSIAASRQKVLLIGVDGLDWEVLLELVNEGRMPNTAKLLARGAHGYLHVSEPLISPAIWTTIATGQPREVHGIDNFFAKIPYEYREAVMSNRHRNVPGLWQIADWAGKSVGVVNWYAARPAEKLRRGVFVSEGIEKPGEVKADQVYPPSWLDRVRSAPLPRFPAYEEELARIQDVRLQKAYDLDRYIFSIAFEIMGELKPDLMMVYFQNLDVLSHGFWKFRWPIGLDYNFPVSVEERERYQKVVEMHYELMDRLIGGFLGEAEDYTVIVVSDHGFAPTYHPHNIFPHLNHLLERLGWLTYQGPTCDAILDYLVAKNYLEVPLPHADSIFTICQQLETETRKWIFHGVPRMEPAAVDAFLSVHYKVNPPETEDEQKEWVNIMDDLSRALVPEGQRQEILWSKTQVWNGKDFHQRVQGLYINLSEREPEGTVPREEYESFRRQVIKQLRSLRTDSRRPLFKMVRPNRAKPVMPTTFADPPDILVEIDRQALLDNVVFRGPSDPDPIPLGAIRWSYHDVSGDHEPGGVFLLSGQAAQTFQHLDISELDLTPTILWLLGIPAGADMPGQILASAFDPPLANRPALYLPSYRDLIRPSVASAPIVPSSELIDQMKAVGYIQTDSAPPAASPSAPQVPAGDTAGNSSP